MAKQTFTTGAVLTAAQMNSLQSNDFNQTVSVKTASYTLVAADKGTRIEFNTSGSVTCTVNTGLFDAGDTVVIQNRGAGDVTVTAGTATVNTAGSLVISQYQSASLYFISASASILFAGAAGDLTAVTSGTGISISNAGGPIPTITNSMATEITASGDIIVGTGNGTFDNLPIGTTGQILTADTTVSPYKVKWAAAASGGFTFTTWTPTWTGLTVGNGTQTARYGTSGKFTYFILTLVFGSTTSVTAGQPDFTLPTTMKSTSNPYGLISLNDAGIDNYFGLGQMSSSKAYCAALYVTGSRVTNNGVSSTVPFTWGTGDSLTYWGSYEEA